PLAPSQDQPIAQVGDLFVLDAHKIVCGDSLDTKVFHRLMAKEVARLVFTDEPYNVRIAGHVTRGNHRDFPMASGELSEGEFLAFNKAWMTAASVFLVDGGLLGTFIDWRGYRTVADAANSLDLSPINLIVWAKTNAGMGSLYRSQHEFF